MKTYAKSFALLLLAVLMTLCFAACGSNGNKKADSDAGSNQKETSNAGDDQQEASGVNGKTYVFDSCTVNGQDATDTITAMYSEQSFAFKDDGVCVQTIVWSETMAEAMGSADPIEQSGTYQENGSTVTVTIPSDEGDMTMEFKVDGDTLTFTEDNSVMVYKVKSNS